MTTTPLASTMHVVACAEGGTTRLEVRPVPAVAAGEMLLRLRCCGLCGTDLFKLATGLAPPGGVLGHELVGNVVATGDDVMDFSTDDRVVVAHHVACGKCALCRRGNETLCSVFRENLLEPGGFSEYVLVRERAVRQAAFRIPDSISDAAAVFVEPAACVLRGLRHSGLGRVDKNADPPGTAVILGGGSMGLLHLLVLRAWRPDLCIVLCDPLAPRRALAERLGAHATYSPDEVDAGKQAVDTLTDGLGADVVFDTVGGRSVLRSALTLLREGGSALLFAHAPQGDHADFDLNDLFKHERLVRGTYSGGRSDQQETFELIASGRLDAVSLVTHTLPLSRFADGVDLTRRHEALKVLFVTDEAAGDA